MTKKEKKEIELPKLPLDLALERLALVGQYIENGLSPDDAADSALELAADLVADSVDRRIGFINLLTGGGVSSDGYEGLIGVAKLNARAWREKAAQLEKVLERIKQRTADIMAERDLRTIEGNTGAFRVQAGQGKVYLAFTTEEKSYSNIISMADAEEYGVDQKFMTQVTFFTLNKEAVRNAIAAGESVPWASIKVDKHLRIDRNVKRISNS